ncbi:MAG: 4Fe-4S binding protein [Candidatus Hodarchaeota archaeon]
MNKGLEKLLILFLGVLTVLLTYLTNPLIGVLPSPTYIWKIYFITLFTVFSLKTFRSYRRSRINGGPYVAKRLLSLLVMLLLFYLIVPIVLFSSPWLGISESGGFRALRQSMVAIWPMASGIIWERGIFNVYYIALSFVLFPVLVLIFGRRAYCGWVCHSGGLPEMLGSGFTAQTSKTDEPLAKNKTSILLLALTIIFTVWAIIFGTGDSFNLIYSMLMGFLISAVIKTGVNLAIIPFKGPRFWCRYLCPAGLIYGLLSKIRHHGILKNNSLCTECKVCNSSCQMGIDITNGEDEIFSIHCIGCGLCVQNCREQCLKLV